MPVGRPSKYKEEYPEMLYDHMARGLSYESFAGLIKVCVDTLYEWEKVHPTFSEAKNYGKPASMLRWEELMLAGAAGDLPKFNASAAIFTMKCRFGWRDEQQITVKKEDSKLIIDLSGDATDGTIPNKTDSD